MSIIDSVKAIYENTDENIIVTDKRLVVLWKSKKWLPDMLVPESFGEYFGKAVKLPVENSMVVRYTDKHTLKIMPLREDAEIMGYMVTFYGAEEIETLYDRSVHYKYKRNMTGNQKLSLMPMLNRLDEYHSQGKDLPSDFFYEAKGQMLKLLSSTVNYSELAKYYSGGILSELMNVSQCLEETAELFGSRFQSSGLDFSYDIQSEMFTEMNYECLRSAVLNLLINAYIYNDSEDRQVRLDARKEGDMIIIQVHDNGHSADIGKLQRAVVPFSGLEKFGQGESLGLALAGRFAEHYGGEVSFDKSELGLTVRVEIDGKTSEVPSRFKLRRQPMKPGEFETASCILAKADE